MNMNRKNKFLEDFLLGKNLNKITSLNLSGKGLDTIPTAVYMCKNLRKLSISHNNLTGIPKEIAILGNLKVLNVSHNALTFIPAPVCRLPKLQTLDVSHNHIKTLPKQLGSSTISNLIINDNSIEIIDYGLIQKIEKLVINKNKIKSFIPNITLPKLKYLWIKDNPCVHNGDRVSISQSLPSLKNYYPNIIESIKNSDAMKSTDVNKNVFISYAHADKEWLSILKIHLGSLQKYVRGLDYWDDRRLRTGDKWKEEIEKALESASAAILLISPNFLASDFITNDELPPILEKANTRGTQIFPVIVRQSLFKYSPISSFQSVNPPEKPLNACSDAEVDEYFCKLMEDIIDKLRLVRKD